MADSEHPLMRATLVPWAGDAGLWAEGWSGGLGDFLLCWTLSICPSTLSPDPALCLGCIQGLLPSVCPRVCVVGGGEGQGTGRRQEKGERRQQSELQSHRLLCLQVPAAIPSPLPSLLSPFRSRSAAPSSPASVSPQ